MSEFEYNNLLFQISQRLDNINAGKQLLVICRGKLAARNEESIPTFSLFEELEEGGFLSFDRLTVLKAILEGVEEWALLEKVEKFACKRKEYNNLLEQIIRVLDELNDLERLISICRGNITEGRRASIHDVRSLFRELESNDCLGIECLALPAGAKLIQIAEGSVNLKVQAENRLALDSLWRMYKNGTLKARLEALFVTDEMREVAGGEGVEIIVTIDEQEYERARDELTTQARGKKNVTAMTPHFKKVSSFFLNSF